MVVGESGLGALVSGRIEIRSATRLSTTTLVHVPFVTLIDALAFSVIPEIDASTYGKVQQQQRRPEMDAVARFHSEPPTRQPLRSRTAIAFHPENGQPEFALALGSQVGS